VVVVATAETPLLITAVAAAVQQAPAELDKTEETVTLQIALAVVAVVEQAVAFLPLEERVPLK
jgi:hypothetical protein